VRPLEAAPGSWQTARRIGERYAVGQ